MMQFTMKQITVWNGHTQLIFTFSDLSRLRVLSFTERLVLMIVLMISKQIYILIDYGHTPGVNGLIPSYNMGKNELFFNINRF